jgi:hypothetical protein
MRVLLDTIVPIRSTDPASPLHTPAVERVLTPRAFSPDPGDLDRARVIAFGLSGHTQMCGLSSPE